MAGDAVERNSAYHAWRDTLRDGFGLSPSETLEKQRAKIQSLLPEYWRPYAPLLNIMLPLNFPETETTSTLTQQTRLDQTRDLLDDLLFGLLCSPAPAVLILEDAHWFDTASWAILVSASQLARKLPLLLIVTTRPMQDAYTPEYIQLQEQPETRMLRLGPLAEAETTALICQHLQTAHVGPALNAFIEEHAEGNPFFADEILLVLLESGFLNHSVDACDLKPGTNTQNIGLPATIQGLIANRIDRLKPAEQMTLKVASVLGRVFSMEIMRAIYPPEAGDVNIDAHLKTLQERDFIVPFSRESYVFKHALTRDAIYNQMLFAQRRKLHRAVAEWVEQTYADDLEPHYALLAHHWEYAIGNPQDDLALTDKVLDALEKAGKQAAAVLIYQEFAEFFSRALALAAKLPNELTEKLMPKLRQMRWHMSLGVAQINLGRLIEGGQALEQVARLSGRTLPNTNTGLYFGILREAIIQIWHRLRPNFSVRTRSNEFEFEQQEHVVSEALSWLFSVNFLSNKLLQSVFTTLSAVNIAENREKAPANLAIDYGVLNLIAHLLRQNRLANIYKRLYLATPVLSNDPLMQSGFDIMVMVRFLGQGEWNQLKLAGEKALTILERQPRAYYVQGVILTQLAISDYLQASYVSNLEKANLVGQFGRMGNNIVFQSWDLNGHVRIHTARGQFDCVQADLEKLKHFLTISITELVFPTYQAKLALALKQWDQAEAHTKKIEQVLSLSPFPTYMSLFSNTVCAEVPLTLVAACHPIYHSS